MELKKIAPYILMSAVLSFALGFLLAGKGNLGCYSVYREIYDYSNNNLNLKAMLQDMPKLGNSDKVIVIEFLDPYCPYSRMYYGNQRILDFWKNRTGREVNPGRPYLIKLAKENKITLYSVEYPLESIHPGSLNVSSILMCIYQRYGSDAYFKFKDDVYLKDEWRKPEDVEKLAYQEGYLVSTDCISNIRNFITRKQMEMFQTFGISGTPSYVIIIRNPDLRKYLPLYKYVLRSGGYGIIMKVDGIESLVIMLSGAQSAEFFASFLS